MNYLLMAIEVEGKIFSTGNNPSLQRLMDLAMFEGRTTATTTRKPHLLFKQKKECLWFNRLELLSTLSSYPIEPCFLASFPPLSTVYILLLLYFPWLKLKSLPQTNRNGEENLSIPPTFFLIEILWRIFFIDNEKEKNGYAYNVLCVKKKKKNLFTSFNRI